MRQEPWNLSEVEYGCYPYANMERFNGPRVALEVYRRHITLTASGVGRVNLPM